MWKRCIRRIPLSDSGRGEFIDIGSTCLFRLDMSTLANGKPCRQRHKGGYVTWAKTGSKSGSGPFVFVSGYVAVLPGFSRSVDGEVDNVKVTSDEPFQGGNSMKGFYGQADEAANQNLRIAANDRGVGATRI